MNTRAAIDAFLAHRRLAFAGLSRNPLDFSRSLFHEFLNRGYQVVPVNPNASEIEGFPCFPSLSAIPQPVEAAILLTRPEAADRIVADCARAGVQHIWLYRATGSGSATAAQLFCSRHNISLVAGECPFMFFPDPAWPHRLHGLCRKLFSTYPQ
jgi:predicted CoA-binding protein